MMTFETAYDHCLRLPTYNKYGDAALKPGFDRIECLLKVMGVPLDFALIIHVAGTNGKGSTCYMISAILQSAGYNVGLHTSPHVVSVTERMRINGRPVAENQFAAYVEEYLELFDKCAPSFFEATLALSLLHFHRQQVDYAVVEVGLGGRLDATNLLSPKVTVITDIDRDHTHILGNTIEEITREKAGIIKPGIPVVFGHNHEQARQVLQDVASATGAPTLDAVDGVNTSVEQHTTCYATTRDRYCVEMGLQGRHQTRNASLAVMVAEYLLPPENVTHAVTRGLENTGAIAGIRGRLEILQRSPLIVVDVAHNPSGVVAALDGLDTLRESGRVFVGLGLMKTKDAATIFDILRNRADQVYPIGIDSQRAAGLAELTQLASATGLPYHRCEHPKQAIKHFTSISDTDDALLLIGSHQIAERVLS